MIAWIISAFAGRREHALAQLANAGPHVQPRIVEAPLGRAAAELGYRGSPVWREPWNNPRPYDLITWGQVACRAGHRMAWERIADGPAPGGFVIEDDCRVLRRFPMQDELESSLEPPAPALYYLGGCPLAAEDKLAMRPDNRTGSEVKGEAWLRAYDTYWGVGYYISKGLAARFLVESPAITNTIPNDEWLPHCYGTSLRATHALSENKCRFRAYIPAKGWYVEPARLPAWQSGTENSDHAFDLRVLLFATNLNKAKRVLSAYGDLGYHCQIVGEGRPDWDTAGKGGIAKLRGYHDQIARLIKDREIHREDLILLSDAYDVLPLGTPKQLIHDFAAVTSRWSPNLPVVIGGEMKCWPDPANERILEHYSNSVIGQYKYPNSGLIMGFAYRVMELLERAGFSYSGIDDQEAIQLAGLTDGWGLDNLIVDGQARLFGNLANARDHYRVEEGYPRNIKHGTWPRIIHANGPDKSLDFQPESMAPALANIGISRRAFKSDPNIIAVPIFVPEQAKRIAEVALGLDGWKPLEGDNYPNDELRVHKADPDLYAFLEEKIMPRLEQAYREHFMIGSIGTIKDAFFSRSVAAKKTLDLHCDISHVSVSIPLRKAAIGGELVWPRNALSYQSHSTDQDIEVGTALLWPGSVTHPHKIRPVLQGERVSLVIWTELR